MENNEYIFKNRRKILYFHLKLTRKHVNFLTITYPFPNTKVLVPIVILEAVVVIFRKQSLFERGFAEEKSCKWVYRKEKIRDNIHSSQMLIVTLGFHLETGRDISD